jgi:hypothetical protein
VTSDNPNWDPEDLNELLYLFDKNDINELEGIFTNLIKDDSDGFVMEFIISVLAARELVELYLRAQSGDEIAKKKSWFEYSKIIAELTQALNLHDN